MFRITVLSWCHPEVISVTGVLEAAARFRTEAGWDCSTHRAVAVPAVIVLGWIT